MELFARLYLHLTGSFHPKGSLADADPLASYSRAAWGEDKAGFKS